jgi:hypothetical protein
MVNPSVARLAKDDSTPRDRRRTLQRGAITSSTSKIQPRAPKPKIIMLNAAPFGGSEASLDGFARRFERGLPARDASRPKEAAQHDESELS